MGLEPTKLLNFTKNLKASWLKKLKPDFIFLKSGFNFILDQRPLAAKMPDQLFIIREISQDARESRRKVQEIPINYPRFGRRTLSVLGFVNLLSGRFGLDNKGLQASSGFVKSKKRRKNNDSMNKMTRNRSLEMVRCGPDYNLNDPPPELAQTLVILAHLCL